MGTIRQHVTAMTKLTFWTLLAIIASVTSTDVEELERTRRDIDPHSNDLHCIDVSTYEDVVWDEVPREKCTATFPKMIESKQERLCEQVTTLQCNVIGYTECTLSLESLPYKGFEMVPKFFQRKKCKESTKIEFHTKKRSECKDVTKQNCVTQWEVFSSGQKVWSGNEDCEPVTWNECKLVEYQVPFKVPAIVCEDAEAIPWDDCITTTKTQQTSRMTCRPYSAVECSPVTSQQCTTVQWTESHQKVVEDCDSSGTVRQPRQEVSHKKKCLLPDTQTALPNGPLQPLKPKEELKQNVFQRNGRAFEDDEGSREGRFSSDGRPSPVSAPVQ